jgi:hypothetical protein
MLSCLSLLEPLARIAECPSLSCICLPSFVQTLGKSCFRRGRSLSAVTFEADSKLSVIEGSAFAECPSLSSICIPSSVTVLSDDCFKRCGSLSPVTFKSWSHTFAYRTLCISVVFIAFVDLASFLSCTAPLFLFQRL